MDEKDVEYIQMGYHSAEKGGYPAFVATWMDLAKQDKPNREKRYHLFVEYKQNQTCEGKKKVNGGY